MKHKYSSLTQIKQAVSTGETTCSILVENYILQIVANRHLNIYIEVFENEARERAAFLDEKFKKDPNSVGKLFGMVVAIKDVICFEGHHVTGGSKILEGFTSLFSATAVERLLAEDAIIIGRVNCDEFAMGSTTENSYYGPTLNGVDMGKIPGGSSGGSAVAVQVDTCLLSLGSDTGGSVRQPAAFCGVLGFKPTYGRISRYGLLAYASSFDQIGILANSVEDIARTLEVIAGPDDFDSTCNQNIERFSARTTVELSSKKQKFRIAYFETALNHPSIDTGVKSSTFNFIAQLEKQGHTIEPVDFAYLDYIIPAYYVLTTAEASSNLSRCDGIRFGYRSAAADDIHSVYKKSRTEGFGAEVKRRIMLGTFVLSAGYYDAYYSKAQKIRRLIFDRTSEILEEFDFILMPASPVPAWEIGKMEGDPVAMYLADIFTVQANMVGMPAISIPIEPHPNGMPLGVQLMANKFQEEKLLTFSRKCAKHLL